MIIGRGLEKILIALCQKAVEEKEKTFFMGKERHFFFIFQLWQFPLELKASP